MNYYSDSLDSFIYNGVSSTSFFMIIEETEGLLDSYERDVEFIEVKGRDGELIIDNQRKKSKDIIVRGCIDVEKANKTVDVLANEIESWLQNTVSYKDLAFSDHKYKYQAICTNQIKLSEIIQDLCEFEIKFKVMPNPKVVS